MDTRPNASFGPKSWTVPFSTASSSAFARRSASRNSRRRCRRAPASPSRCCRSLSRRSTRSSAAVSSSRLAEDSDARDVAEAAAWFLGDESVALFPSRGVRWESGLEPTPHLVGERARALDVLARGGLVCVSATALAEGMPPAADRPAPLHVAQGDEPGIDLLASELADAGYERVERVEERGQFAVRGGLVDVYPTTGREPLRIELFGDEIEQIRAFSAVHAAGAAPDRDGDDLRRPPSVAARSPRSTSPTRTSRSASPTTSSRRSTARRTSSGHPTTCAPSGRRRGSTPVSLEGATELVAAAAGAAVLVRRAAPGARRSRPVRSRERAERPAAAGARHRRRVPASRRGPAPAGAAAPLARDDARAG